MSGKLLLMSDRSNGNDQQAIIDRALLERCAREANHAWHAASAARSGIELLRTDFKKFGDVQDAHGASIEAVEGNQGALLHDVSKALTLVGSPGDQRNAPTGLYALMFRLEAKLEARGSSQSEIVEGIARVHIDEETTEIRERKEAIRRQAVWTYWLKKTGTWLFVGGGMAILGALAERCW